MCLCRSSACRATGVILILSLMECRWGVHTHNEFLCYSASLLLNLHLGRALKKTVELKQGLLLALNPRDGQEVFSFFLIAGGCLALQPGSLWAHIVMGY